MIFLVTEIQKNQIDIENYLENNKIQVVKKKYSS